MRTSVVALFALLAATNAHASATPCRLDVWPAGKTLAVIYYDPFRQSHDRPFLVADGRNPEPQALTPAHQLAVLRSLDLTRLLALPADTTIVFHDEPLPRLSAVQPVRHVPATTPCQAELAVTTFVYENAIYTAPALRLMLNFREFAPGEPSPSRSFGGSAIGKLYIFPARREDQRDAAIADLEQAYRTAITMFAANLAKSAVLQQRPGK